MSLGCNFASPEKSRCRSLYLGWVLLLIPDPRPHLLPIGLSSRVGSLVVMGSADG